MKLTTKETNALIARLTALSDSITALTAVINPADVPTDHVECAAELTAVQTAMDSVKEAMPVVTSSGTGAASSTVAGSSEFRRRVDAGYDEA
jgi:hypothetical protein